MWPTPQFPADLVTFTEKTLNGKPHFLCSENAKFKSKSKLRSRLFFLYLV